MDVTDGKIAGGRPRLIDVSHVIEDGLITYPGLPGPVVCDYLSRAQSRQAYTDETTFQISRIEMVANTGTYVDSPFHRFEDGADLAALDLHQLAALPGIVLDVTGHTASHRAIDAALLQQLTLDLALPLRGRAVLVRSDWARHWATPRYLSGHPYLTRDAAQWLRDEGVVLVGIDSLNMDDMDDRTRPAHTVLLGAGITIVEHLCALEDLPASGFRFHAVPVKFRGVGTFPVRAYGVVEG